MTRPAILRHRLVDEAERELRPTCDACGDRVPVVYRDVVEGIACDRCPTCHEDGAVP